MQIDHAALSQVVLVMYMVFVDVCGSVHVFSVSNSTIYVTPHDSATFLWKALPPSPFTSSDELLIKHNGIQIGVIKLGKIDWDSNNTRTTFHHPNMRHFGFILNDIIPNDGGIYECTYTDGFEMKPVQEDIVLVVQDKPSKPHINMEISIALNTTNLSLTCSSTCLTTPRDKCQPLLVTWSSDGSLITNESVLNVEVDLDDEGINYTREFKCSVREESSILTSGWSEPFVLSKEVLYDLYIKQSATQGSLFTVEPDILYRLFSGNNWILWLTGGCGLILVLVVVGVICGTRGKKREPPQSHVEDVTSGNMADSIKQSNSGLLRTQWEDGVPSLRPPTRHGVSLYNNGQVLLDIGEFGHLSQNSETSAGKQ